jgi:hypothetical protein
MKTKSLDTVSLNLLDPSIKVQHRFPNFKELTKNYFNRVQLWAEMFMKRKKFESGGLTSASTGMSSLALPLSLLSLALGLFIRPYGHLVSAVFFIIYLLGYIGFFSFILAGKKPCWIIPFLGLNIFFTCVISLGACYGVCRSLLGYKNVQL